MVLWFFTHGSRWFQRQFQTKIFSNIWAMSWSWNSVSPWRAYLVMLIWSCEISYGFSELWKNTLILGIQFTEFWQMNAPHVPNTPVEIQNISLAPRSSPLHSSTQFSPQKITTAPRKVTMHWFSCSSTIYKWNYARLLCLDCFIHVMFFRLINDVAYDCSSFLFITE